MGIYEDIQNMSHRSSNDIKIVINIDGKEVEISKLSWEDIVDIEKALNLVSLIKSRLITLNFPPDVDWENDYKHFGENTEDAYNKFEFLLKHFVGSFDY